MICARFEEELMLRKRDNVGKMTNCAISMFSWQINKTQWSENYEKIMKGKCR